MQQPKPNLPPPQPINIFDDYDVRRQLSQTLMGFCGQYLMHYFTLLRADFHKELFSLLEDWSIKFLSIIGFRGSAKSSIGSLALPLWAALEGKAKFIVLIAETSAQAQLLIANLRYELEGNEYILRDYGDMSKGISKQEEWTKHNLLLSSGVRIMARSRGQRIRGLRHRQYRPDLVIIDDPEETEKVEKKEYRDKTERWLRNEVIPAIEETSARLIILGNILHTDAMMARLKKDPIFLHRDYPLLVGEEAWENCTWKAKYPTPEALKRQEEKVRRTAWMREYLLKVVPPEGQEVKDEWIQYYDALPMRYEDEKTKLVVNPILQAGVAVDLAISKKETADFTAMVSGITAYVEGMPKLFILPNPVNARLSFFETIQQMKATSAAMKKLSLPTFFIEDVAYQRAAIEEAIRHGIPAEAIKVGTDKRARLRAAATFIQNGMVLFPRKGAEDLIAQLTGFGIEDHDDLMDACVHLILGIRSEGMEKPEVVEIL